MYNRKISIKKNFVLYLIKQLVSVAFPMITFTYAARVLGVEGIGAVNYSKSVITYFTLIAAFGITNYAIREGAGIREDNQAINQFASEIFTINLLSTIFAAMCCGITIAFPIFEKYRKLLFCFSLLIPSALIGVEWVYNIYEDYVYITLRSIGVQILSLLLMLIFVKNIDHCERYAIITVLATGGANLFNYYHARKYVRIKITVHGLKKHLNSIIVIFFTTLASQIYLNMDVTMVGYFAGDRATGLYSASHKLVLTLTTLISTLRTVLMPRLSYYLGNSKDKKRYEQLNDKSLNILFAICIPMIVGIFLLAEDAIFIFCGKEYLDASITLRILTGGMFFSALNGYIVYQLLIPQKKEKTALTGTVVGATINLLSNVILIPIYKENGAAVGTCIAEISVFAYCYYMSKKMFKIRIFKKSHIQYVIASLVMLSVCIGLKGVSKNILLNTFSVVIGGGITYLFVLILLRNEFAYEFLSFVSKIRIKK